MKLLICTQKVDINDDVLGFFHGWLKEFAAHCDELTVICLQCGEYNLPDNVRVLSLGKEKKISRLKYILKFYRYIWRERKNYDQVFVHMNPEYVVLGGIFWRITGKKIGLWYVHREVNLKLRIAAKLAHQIFTASAESFRLKSKKIKIIGHGIDINKFKPPKFLDDNKNIFVIIYAGRISEIKNQMLLIEAINILVNKNNIKNIKVKFIGRAAGKNNELYLQLLKTKAQEYNLNNYMEFFGGASYSAMPDIYAQADLAVNLCPTGGVDKAVLEAMASGNLVLALNQTFADIIGRDLILSQANSAELADKIKQTMNFNNDKKAEIRQKLREKIEHEYSLNNLINKILNE